MSSAAAATPRVANPYQKNPHNEGDIMGRQSQQRVSNQHKRKFKLASKSPRPKQQRTLDNTVAFESAKDCIICKAKEIQRYLPTYRLPKRAHHVLCLLNKTTKGLGNLSKQTIASLEDNKRYKTLTAAIRPEERFSSKHNTKGAGATFFAARTTTTTTTMTEIIVSKKGSIDEEDMLLSPVALSDAVGKLVNNVDFQERHKSKSAPLAMIAFATEVTDKIIRQKKEILFQHFNGIEMEVPGCDEGDNNPHYHSITGSKLLYVDWERTHGIQVSCPDSTCAGTLKSDRSNFSKNKTLFPIFGLDGSPVWCIVMSLLCPRCCRRFNANEADVLVNLPEHVADAYPVDSTYALGTYSCHLARAAADVFATIMVTYGNGELCSKLLYNAMNRDYIRKIKVYYSRAKNKNSTTTPYLEKDGTFIKQFPPLGHSIRDMYDAASSSEKNPWCISDHDRHIREIQSVGTNSICCQDHTFQVVKNYMKGLGAKAVWDAATGTGEIASAVLVPSTKTEDFAHAAQQLMRRPHFDPKVKYSDTWPNKKEFWQCISPGIEGRLGLFHFQKRIVSTLRKKHIDYNVAVTDLLASLYAYCEEDYEQLLVALKNGTLSRTGKKYSSDEISDMKRSSMFRERYSKYLRKKLHQPETISQMLDDWFCRYKVTSSDPVNNPARGRLDPDRLEPLFTVDTKPAIENCKGNACYLSDALPINEMYHHILPNPNSSHQLTEYLSLRGESKLEAFHDRFAHFANCGMRNSLADNLNLAGTARYNLAIRHKRSLAVTSQNPHEKAMLSSNANPNRRKKIPAGWEKVVPFFNHSELWHINKMAAAVGCGYPFPMAEALPEDNGERFFSEYMTVTMPSLKGISYGKFGECLCVLCSQKNISIVPPATTTAAMILDDPHQQQQNKEQQQSTNNNNVNSDIVPRQKASRPQQPTVWRIANTANTATMPFVGAPHIPIAPLIPMPYQIPFCYNMIMSPQMMPCCNKYAAWLTTRVGRPPHHPLCQRR